MEQKTTHILRRMIGKVNIFDLFGEVDGEWIEGIKAYIESYIKEFHFKNVILNIQPVKKVNNQKAHEILNILLSPKKSALYFNSPDIMEQFMQGLKTKKIELCNSLGDILKIFGRELLERDKMIQFQERRKSIRLKTALFAQIDFIDKNNHSIGSQAIITNLSQNGMFAEYLDLKSAFDIENLDYFKNLKLKINMQNPDTTSRKSIVRNGHILRIEFSGTQTGIAIQFEK